MARTGQPINDVDGQGGFVVTKSNTVDLVDDPNNTVPYADLGYSVYIGGTGNVSAVGVDGSVVVFTAFAVGKLPILVKRINSTGTTATNMVAIKGR